MGLVEIALGPEMKSTGEVMGIGRTYQKHCLKLLMVPQHAYSEDGTILATEADRDKERS